jgi:hypothetical protein
MLGGKNRKMKLDPLVNNVCCMRVARGPRHPPKSEQPLGARPAYKHL